jgi:uncharacterized glyoxalase superfamily protein PhnB
VSTNTDTTIVLHSTAFASWWDETGPLPSPGGPQVDLELESSERVREVMSELAALGARVVKRPTAMPWGQHLAIVLDPDGYRVGLKAPLREPTATSSSSE